MKQENEVDRIAEEIQCYFLNHPNAADTLEGITRWWLTRQRYIDSMDCVHNALDVLIKQGLVKKNTNVDGKYIYMSSSNIT